MSHCVIVFTLKLLPRAGSSECSQELQLRLIDGCALRCGEAKCRAYLIGVDLELIVAVVVNWLLTILGEPCVLAHLAGLSARVGITREQPSEEVHRLFREHRRRHGSGVSRILDINSIAVGSLYGSCANISWYNETPSAHRSAFAPSYGPGVHISGAQYAGEPPVFPATFSGAPPSSAFGFSATSQIVATPKSHSLMHKSPACAAASRRSGRSDAARRGLRCCDGPSSAPKIDEGCSLAYSSRSPWSTAPATAAADIWPHTAGGRPGGRVSTSTASLPFACRDFPRLPAAAVPAAPLPVLECDHAHSVGEHFGDATPASVIVLDCHANTQARLPLRHHALVYCVVLLGGASAAHQGEQHILRLDVTVHDSLRVQVSQTDGDVARDTAARRLVHGAINERVGQHAAVDVLHAQENFVGVRRIDHLVQLHNLCTAKPR